MRIIVGQRCLLVVGLGRRDENHGGGRTLQRALGQLVVSAGDGGNVRLSLQLSDALGNHRGRCGTVGNDDGLGDGGGERLHHARLDQRLQRGLVGLLGFGSSASQKMLNGAVLSRMMVMSSVEAMSFVKAMSFVVVMLSEVASLEMTSFEMASSEVKFFEAAHFAAVVLEAKSSEVGFFEGEDLETLDVQTASLEVAFSEVAASQQMLLVVADAQVTKLAMNFAMNSAMSNSAVVHSKVAQLVVADLVVADLAMAVLGQVADAVVADAVDAQLVVAAVVFVLPDGLVDVLEVLVGVLQLLEDGAGHGHGEAAEQ